MGGTHVGKENSRNAAPGMQSLFMPFRSIAAATHAPLMTRHAVLVRFYAAEFTVAVLAQTDQLVGQVVSARVDALALLLFPAQG